MRIILTDARHADIKTVELHYEGGLREFVKYLDRAKKPLVDTPITISAEKDGITVEVAMWWNDSYHENVLVLYQQHSPAGRRHASGRLSRCADAPGRRLW